MTRIITDLGTLGTISGIQRPIDFVVQRDGAAWNLTGYTNPILKVRTVLGVAVAANGTLSVVTPTTGSVRYTPGTADPFFTTSGAREAICYFTPPAGGAPEPSAVFRYSIVDGPPAA
jgi:hypothetical protein